MGIVSIVGGIALIAYALAFLGNPTAFLPLCFIVTGVGGVGQGLSVLGARKLAFPFNLLTIIGGVYIIYRIVLIFLRDRKSTRHSSHAT